MTKDSRLERFLKALCSLDYSDLPTPLSRVEVLWNCLITGEATPDFQPQSRTEKYLMSILGVYDLEDIPKPISRAETLLYKLATGDTDVELEDCVKSRYERLLSEIVANGGVGDNVDFEYVTYVLSESFNTLYNTDEAPVKSAILKGQTLINILPTDYTISGSDTVFFIKKNMDETMIKPNTKYFMRLYNTHNNITSAYFKPCVEDRLYFSDINNKYLIFTTKSEFTDNDFKNNKIHFYTSSVSLNLEDVINTKILLCEYQEGMENWDIPYFGGMQSVKMPVLTTTGKNLFDGEYELDKYLKKDGMLALSADWATTKNYIRVKPNTTYTQNIHMSSTIAHVVFYDKNKNIIGTEIGSDIENSATYTTPNNCYYIKTCYKYSSVGNHLFQVEQGSQSSRYDSYKSNILTVNEPVELRGIGDIKDELDLVTGELTQRIGENVLNGKDGFWSFNTPQAEQSKTSVRFTYSKPVLVGANTPNYNVKSDKLPTLPAGSTPTNEIFGITGLYGELLYLYIPRSVIALEIDDNDITSANAKIKEYFDKLGDVEVQYKLATESVKTVDLITLDQDGNETKLKTFNDITHVSLSSEGLIPDAEMTVATKNLDDISQASTMSLRMNDISNRQNELQNEVDTQSESIDSTMMATTEIYEQTL